MPYSKLNGTNSSTLFGVSWDHGSALSHRTGTSDPLRMTSTVRKTRLPSVRAVPGQDLPKLLNYLFDRDQKITTLGTGASQIAYSSSGYAKLYDNNGCPGAKGPWGTLNAIDLSTGKTARKVPLGEYPKLKAQGIPKTGTVNFGGPMVTAGGLIFCAGTQDRKIREFDKNSGREL